MKHFYSARFTGVALLLGLVLVSASSPPRKKPSGDDAQYAETQLKKLQKEKEEEQKKLDAAKAALAVKLDELDQNEREINKKENNFARLQQNLSRLEVQRNWLKAELKRTEDSLDELGRASRQRLVNLYKEGSKPVLAYILESKDGADFFDRLYYSKLMVGQDMSMLDVLRNAEAELERLRTQYNAKSDEVEILAEKVHEEKLGLEDEKAKLEIQKRQIESTKEAAEQQLAKMQKEEEDWKNIIQMAAGENADLAFNGRFYPPLASITVTSPFGMRKHPISRNRKMHNGVDLRAATGTIVHAAARGLVIKADYDPGFGWVVILYHGTFNGRSYSSIYAHNQKVIVNKDEFVEAGEEISNSDNTGYSKAPHLHFEIQVDEVPVDPMKFIKGVKMP